MRKIKIGLTISLLLVIGISILGFYLKTREALKKKVIKKEIENIEKDYTLSQGKIEALEKYYRITLFDEKGYITYDTFGDNKDNLLYKEETLNGYSFREKTLFVVKKLEKNYIRLGKKIDFSIDISVFLEYLVFALVLGTLVIMLFTETTFTPLSNIINFTKEIEKGNYKARITYFGEKDIELIAKILNYMAESIDKRNEELKERTNLLTNFIENLPIGVALLSKNGKIIMFNSSLEVMLNTNIKENSYYYECIKNSKIIDFLALSTEKKTITTKIPIRGETEEDFIIYNFLAYNTGENIILIVSNITEEEKLSRLKSRFISDITHEFKTPLSIVLGYAEVLSEKLSGEEKYYTQRIKANIIRLNEIINDLVKLEKVEHLDLFDSKKEIQINKIIDSVIKDLTPFAKKKGISIVYNQDKNIKINGIEELMYYSFYNILENAIKYHDKKENAYVEIKLDENTDEISISFIDNGPGIPLQERLNIFRRFYRINKNRTREEDNGGSGLGLSIVREAIRVHNGKVICEENKKENGSCFKIIIPKE